MRLVRSSRPPICYRIVWDYCIRILLPSARCKDRRWLPAAVSTGSASSCFSRGSWTWSGRGERASCHFWDLFLIFCGRAWWNGTVWLIRFSTWTRIAWVFGPGSVVCLWFWRVPWRRACWGWARCALIYSSAWINEYIRTVNSTIINNQNIRSIARQRLTELPMCWNRPLRPIFAFIFWCVIFQQEHEKILSFGFPEGEVFGVGSWREGGVVVFVGIWQIMTSRYALLFRV